MTKPENKSLKIATETNEEADRLDKLVLEEMARLDDLARASNEHIPFEVALAYVDGVDVDEVFRAHIETCAYCQEMIADLCI